MSTNSGYERPLPLSDAQTAPYWEAAKRHELVLQRCADCGKLRFPPSANCVRCSSENVSWVQVTGKGSVFSYVIVHQAMMPAFKAVLPYNVVQVALDDDPTVVITGNVAGDANDQLRIGAPLELVFDDVTPEDTIPRWRIVNALKR